MRADQGGVPVKTVRKWVSLFGCAVGLLFNVTFWIVILAMSENMAVIPQNRWVLGAAWGVIIGEILILAVSATLAWKRGKSASLLSVMPVVIYVTVTLNCFLALTSGFY